MDAMVLATQQWLNKTYGNDDRFNMVVEDGITGWGTIYGLRRALQIELGIENTSNNFGPTTYSLCPNVNQGEQGNIVRIIQGGLWCKGYSPAGFDGYYGNGTYVAVMLLKQDMGFLNASGNMNRDVMKALLDMSAFVCLSNGSEEIRDIQQQLNYNYYDYFQICPCDGLYNRDMNKMLIYALQKELGIAKSSATGSWGPTTIAKCKERKFNIGDSSKIIKLIRYALVCNGFSVSTTSSIYDDTLDRILQKFSNSLRLEKKLSEVSYTIIKSLLSSNGDTERSALGCDTASKLTNAQIETLKANGYRFVGRYISNTPGGTLDKALTKLEIKNILNAGLKLFYIFQESNNSASKFNTVSGLEQVKRAKVAIENLELSINCNIYFAVDCDPLDSEIKNNIIPYFKSIFNEFENTKETRGVGVYGTRNVCLQLKKVFPTIKLFISDASYGFSGNLGFSMPEEWAFDQFATDLTLGSGEGRVSIDKVAVSYRDNCNYEDIIEKDEVVCYPGDDEINKEGRLMVNMNDEGLHIYECVRYFPWYYDDEKDYNIAYPKTKDLVYTLPKYGFYLDIGAAQKDKYFISTLIKYLDNYGKIKYGYIVKEKEFYISENSPIQIGAEPQILQDVDKYGNQRDFFNYIVNSNHDALVPSSRVSIENHSCVIYKLKRATRVYDLEGKFVEEFAKDTEIALDENKSGSTHNELIRIFRVKVNGNWVSPLHNIGETTTGFLDYQLENGCMPADRTINN